MTARIFRKAHLDDTGTIIKLYYDKRYKEHVSTKTVDAQFISHYAFQSDNRSSSGEILQTHKDKAAPFGKTKIVSGFLMVLLVSQR